MTCSSSSISKSSMSSMCSTSSSKLYSLPRKYCSIFFLFSSIQRISSSSFFAASSRSSSSRSLQSPVSASPKYSSSMCFRSCAAVFTGAMGISRRQTSFTPGRSLAAPKQRQPPKPGISLPCASNILAFLMARQSLPPSSLMRISQQQSSRRRRLMSSLRALISFSGRARFWISSTFSMMLVVTCLRHFSHSLMSEMSRIWRMPFGRSSSSLFTSARFIDHHLFSMPCAFSQFRAIKRFYYKIQAESSSHWRGGRNGIQADRHLSRSARRKVPWEAVEIWILCSCGSNCSKNKSGRKGVFESDSSGHLANFRLNILFAAVVFLSRRRGAVCSLTLPLTLSNHSESEAGCLARPFGLVLLLHLLQQRSEERVVQADFLELGPFHLTLDHNSPAPLEVALQLGVVWLPVGLQAAHVLECPREGRSHLGEEAVAVVDLQLPDLAQFVVDFGQQARPGQFAVVEVGEDVEESLQIIFFGQLLLVMGADAGKTVIPSKGAEVLGVLADGDRLCPAEAHQLQLSLVRTQNAARLQVLVEHSCRVQPLHHAQQLQGKVCHLSQRKYFPLQPFSNVLQLQKGTASPLAELEHSRHATPPLQLAEELELVREGHLRTRLEAGLDFESNQGPIALSDSLENP